MASAIAAWLHFRLALIRMNAFITPSWIGKLVYRVWHWETWHWLIKYIPMIPFWIWHCIKARSFWFFTSSNPTLTFGGYEGESKIEMYRLLPDGSYPKTILIHASLPTGEIKCILKSSGLSFPIAVKPDVGRMGLLFRRINSLSELLAYDENMKADYLLQEFVTYPLEVSVFYYRLPGTQNGTITGFVRKDHLSVTGDGTSTLLSLMENYQRVQFRLQEMKVKHAAKLHEIIPAGETYVLCQALNLSRGGKLVSLACEKDDRLLRIIDAISYNGNFFFGRYDIKCRSVEDLKNGKNFKILEFNGSGAEPHHVYGNGNSLIKAIRILLHHWKILYQISVANHRKGIPYWTFMRGIRHLLMARKHFQWLKAMEFQANHAAVSTATNTPDKITMLQSIELTVDKTIQ